MQSTDDDVDDDELSTCHTFETDGEARAFMLGFHVAASDGICCDIDGQEPNTILIDFVDAEADSRDEAHGHYLKTIAAWNQEADEIPAGERSIVIEWTVDSVHRIREGLTDDQAWQVLQAAKKDYDPALGITNDRLWYLADRMFPEQAGRQDGFDEDLAVSEGWSIFDAEGDLQIQRLDCPNNGDGAPIDPLFPDDDAAIEFVINQANLGSQYHIDALAFVYAYELARKFGPATETSTH